MNLHMEQYSYSVGYFANTRRWTKTHIYDGRKPVCGSQIGKTLSYQWCAHGYKHFDYLECEHCKDWYRRKLNEEVKMTEKK